MKPGIQTFLSEAGEAACYALDIIQLASEETGKTLDPIAMLQVGIKSGIIHYNEADQNDNDNFFVRDPALFLSIMTGQQWTARHESANYTPVPDERVVQRWERKTVAGTISHFRLPEWDSLVDSKTVKYGAIASLRVFRRVS